MTSGNNLAGATLAMLWVLAATPASQANNILQDDYCVDDEHGFRTETYACTLYCSAGEDVGGVIATDQQVDQILVSADCGTAYDAEYCTGSSYCATQEKTTATTAKGHCEGYSKELNYAEHYWGDLYCYSNNDNTGNEDEIDLPDLGDGLPDPGDNDKVARILEMLQPSDPGGVSCEDLADAIASPSWTFPSFVQISFSVSHAGVQTSAVSIKDGVCEQFTPRFVVLDDGWLIQG